MTLDQRIDGGMFIDLDKSALEQFGLSYGGKKRLLEVIENLVRDLHNISTPSQIHQSMHTYILV